MCQLTNCCSSFCLFLCFACLFRCFLFDYCLFCWIIYFVTLFLLLLFSFVFFLGGIFFLFLSPNFKQRTFPRSRVKLQTVFIMSHMPFWRMIKVHQPCWHEPRLPETFNRMSRQPYVYCFAVRKTNTSFSHFTVYLNQKRS